jgi:hypothetical protein
VDDVYEKIDQSIRDLPFPVCEEDRVKRVTPPLGMLAHTPGGLVGGPPSERAGNGLAHVRQ